MAINKVIKGNEVLIDLTADTVTADKIQSGFTAHIANGDTVTCTFDSDTSDDTALVAEVLSGQTFHARGAEMTGTMPNRGAVTGTISTKDQSVSIQQGYHDGSGAVVIDSTEQSKIIPDNIKSGVEILGVTGNYVGSGGTYQSKTATPTFTQQVITPDAGYDALSQVTVAAIPVTETPNSAGGITLTVGG
jgi:hypothetical protein